MPYRNAHTEAERLVQYHEQAAEHYKERACRAWKLNQIKAHRRHLVRIAQHLR